MNTAFPLGIDNFEKLRSGAYYYVDKTLFIYELLSKQFEANLITRPRRFGKTLAMSMLDNFFDISRDSRERFEGLKISENVRLCEEWMNQWPTVFITLKSVEGLDFEGAYGMLVVLIASMCKKYAFLEQSERVDSADKEIFGQLKSQRASKENLKDSLVLLTRMMSAHYGKQVILLVDEYDIPLAKASENGYYTEMMDVLRALFGGALKTNEFLKFAVITGCLKIVKESIFTGINNLVADTITGGRFEEYFGFSEVDVKKMLRDTGLTEYASAFREWYDGYRFGEVDVYCPWDVLNYANALQDDARPCAAASLLGPYQWKLYFAELFAQSKPDYKKRDRSPYFR